MENLKKKINNFITESQQSTGTIHEKFKQIDRALTAKYFEEYSKFCESLGLTLETERILHYHFDEFARSIAFIHAKNREN